MRVSRGICRNRAVASKLLHMPPSAPQPPEKTLHDVVDELGTYPIEAFIFLHEALAYTVEHLHGKRKDPEQNMHVSGQQLCQGLRDFAMLKYGMLAGTVLRRWGVNGTVDFGRMVFSMIDAGMMSRTDSDTLDDFRNVYDFRTTFDGGVYQIPQIK